MKKNRPPEWQQLTGRQRQVALLVAAGKSSKEIARELDIHYTTVMKHRENLYARLGGGQRLVAGVLALRFGRVKTAGRQAVRFCQYVIGSLFFVHENRTMVVV